MEVPKFKQSNIIFFYIFKQILLYTGVVFLFAFVIFFVNNILVSIQDDLIKNVSGTLIAKFLVYSMPIVIANAAPYSAFIGTLMCFGRFVSDYEIVALNALGFSTRKILIPTLAAGLFVAVFGFFVNDILIPISAEKLNQVQVDMITSSPALQIEPYAIKRDKELIMITGDIKGNTIKDLLIIDNSDSKQMSFLGAGVSELHIEKPAGILFSIGLKNPRLVNVQKSDKTTFDFSYGEELTYNILMDDVKNNYSVGIGAGQMSSVDLYKKIVEIKKNPDTPKATLNYHNLEFQKKFSIPFSAFFFIVLAFALSTSIKMYNQGIGFAVGLLISVGYWAILLSGQEITIKKSINSIITMWLPNTLLFLLTIILIWKKLIK